MLRPFLRFLFVGLLLGPVLVRASPRDIEVKPAGPIRTLTEAVARAHPHQRIVVYPGLYREPTIVVDKPLEIIGVNYPVFDGRGEHQILTITADSVTIQGLSFRNVSRSFVEDRAAIQVDGGNYCTIAGNRLDDTFFGIYLARSAYCHIQRNDIRAYATTESYSGNGIHLWYCRYITIEGNHIRGHRDGIYFEFVEDSAIIGNLSEYNLRYGLHFMFSDRCSYRENVFRNNDAGVAVMYTRHVEMVKNRFEHNWGSASYGLLLKDITDSHVRDNVFLNNTTGIYSEGSNRITIEHNDLLQNGWAVKIMANSNDNLFTHNNFIGNSFDVATNSRQSFSTFEENYWDHYTGYDLEPDGFGDVAYRPVRLFAVLVEQNPPLLILLHSLFVRVLDAAERVIPSLTPGSLADPRPVMRRFP